MAIEGSHYHASAEKDSQKYLLQTRKDLPPDSSLQRTNAASASPLPGKEGMGMEWGELIELQSNTQPSSLPPSEASLCPLLDEPN